LKSFLGLPLWLWVIFGLAALVAAAYFIREQVRMIRARRAIDNVISSVAYDELRNVLLPTGSGDQIHVNYLLLTQKGLLLIDLFDTHGMIFAGEKMEQWSIFGPKRHFMITNPLPMLYDRVATVRQFAGDAVPVEGRIVFSMRGEFPKGRPEAVIRLDELQDDFPVVEKSAGGAAAAFADVWERIKSASQPNPLAH
jgi:Nuclease-related domain